MDKLSEISKWDVLNVYNKVKNVVMNYTEYEIKVHEATGPEPWGASSTLMREIADGTRNRKHLEEIMPAIYLRFNDTDPSNWRQVYKALQLLEYLVKNGSERVVDEVQSHITLVKMLKNFHHIDASGKDQGINVRQRSKELVDLVQDKDRLRDERRKAKENLNKYGGFSGGAGQSSFGNTTGSNRYTGFGSDSIGRSGGGGIANKYTGFGSDSIIPSSSRFDDRSDSGSSNYPLDADDRRTPKSVASSSSASRQGSRQRTPANTKPVTPAAPTAPAQPVVADLFSFDDDDFATSSVAAPVAPPAATGSKPAAAASNLDVFASIAMPAATSSAAKAPAATSNAFEDDWGDFQSSSSSAPAVQNNTASTINIAKPIQPLSPTTSNLKPAAQPSNPMMDLLGGGNDFNQGFQAPLPMSPTGANNTSSGNPAQAFGAFQQQQQQQPLSPTAASGGKMQAKPAQKSAAFSDIWDMSSDLLSLDSLSISMKGSGSGGNSQNQTSRVSMNQLSSQQKNLF
ncbi:Epsin-3, clathrin recruitment and traffic between the Golgi and endosome [Coemansia sp. Benny D115]|nr:Epsin-3, clathrin recruitment and traffic between the Golgi and endosome [Coemansia sp. Benny D115]